MRNVVRNGEPPTASRGCDLISFASTAPAGFPSHCLPSFAEDKWDYKQSRSGISPLTFIGNLL